MIQLHWPTLFLGFGIPIGLLLFKTAANALPPKGEPFQFGQWLMEWIREVAQQAPDKLNQQQMDILKGAGIPYNK